MRLHSAALLHSAARLTVSQVLGTIERMFLGEDGPLESATAAIDALMAIDITAVDEDELMAAVLGIEVLARRIDAVRAVAMGRLDSSGCTQKQVGLPARRWKAIRTHGAPPVVARELLVARTLTRFGAFAEAMRAGAIGSEHVLALANACNERVEAALVELEDGLVTFASRHRFTVYQRHLRNLVAILDQDGPVPDCGDVDRARMSADGNGNLLVDAEFSGHNAVTAQRIIQAETDRQYRMARSEHETAGSDIPPMAVLRARALQALLRRGARARVDDPKPVVEAILPVTVDSEGNPTGIHSVDGQQLDDVSAAVLICDAHLQPVVVDASGSPLRLGRTRRLFSPAQRRAMIVRDGGCIFPGCEAPVSQCDAHHFVPFGRGGPTDIDRGAFLCRRHHGLVHSSEPWEICVCTEDQLPARLLCQHRERAAGARLRPARTVITWRGPGGRRLLAQNAIDHRGPAPPRRRAAA